MKWNIFTLADFQFKNRIICLIRLVLALFEIVKCIVKINDLYLVVIVVLLD